MPNASNRAQDERAKRKTQQSQTDKFHTVGFKIFSPQSRERDNRGEDQTSDFSPQQPTGRPD